MERLGLRAHATSVLSQNATAPHVRLVHMFRVFRLLAICGVSGFVWSATSWAQNTRPLPRSPAAPSPVPVSTSPSAAVDISPNEPHHEALLRFPIAWPFEGLETPMPEEFRERPRELTLAEVASEERKILSEVSLGAPTIQGSILSLSPEVLESYPRLAEAYILGWQGSLNPSNAIPEFGGGSATVNTSSLDLSLVLRQLRALSRAHPAAAALLFRTIRQHFSGILNSQASTRESFYRPFVLLAEVNTLLAEQALAAGRGTSSEQQADLAQFSALFRRPGNESILNYVQQCGVSHFNDIRGYLVNRVEPLVQRINQSSTRTFQSTLERARPPSSVLLHSRMQNWLTGVDRLVQQNPPLDEVTLRNLLVELLQAQGSTPSLIDQVVSAVDRSALVQRLERGIQLLRAHVRRSPEALAPAMTALRHDGPRPFHEQQIIATIFGAGVPPLVDGVRSAGLLREIGIDNRTLQDRLFYAGYVVNGSTLAELRSLSSEQRFINRINSISHSRSLSLALIEAIEADATILTRGSPSVSVDLNILLEALDPAQLSRVPNTVDLVLRSLSRSYLESKQIEFLHRWLPHLNPEARALAYELLTNGRRPVVIQRHTNSGMAGFSQVSRALTEMLASWRRENRTRGQAPPQASAQRTPNQQALRQAQIAEIEERYRLRDPGASSRPDYPEWRQRANREIAALELLDESPPVRRRAPPVNPGEALRQRLLREFLVVLRRETPRILNSVLANDLDRTHFDTDGVARRYTSLIALQSAEPTSLSALEQQIDRSISELGILAAHMAEPRTEEGSAALFRLCELLEQILPIRRTLERSGFAIARLEAVLAPFENGFIRESDFAAASNRVLQRSRQDFTQRQSRIESARAAVAEGIRANDARLAVDEAPAGASFPPVRAQRRNVAAEPRRFAGAANHHASFNDIINGAARGPATVLLRHHRSWRQYPFFTEVAIDELPSASAGLTRLEPVTTRLPAARVSLWQNHAESMVLRVPVTTPEMPVNGFVAIATPIESLASLDITKLTVTAVDGRVLVQGVDYEVVQIASRGTSSTEIGPYNRRGYGLRMLRDFSSGVRYRAVFALPAARRLSSAVPSPNLPVEAVESVSRELRSEGFTAIADSFDGLVRGRQPITIDALTRAFSEVSVYSFTPENPSANNTTRFGRFRAFLGLENNPGVLCAVCNGGNSLFPQILNAVFQNASLPFSAMPVSGLAPLVGSSISTTNNGHRISRVVHTPSGTTVDLPDATPELVSQASQERLRAVAQQEPLVGRMLREVRQTMQRSDSLAAMRTRVNQGRDRLARALMARYPLAARVAREWHAIQEDLAAYDALAFQGAETVTPETPPPSTAVPTLEAAPEAPDVVVRLTPEQHSVLEALRAPVSAHERTLIYRTPRGGADTQADPEVLVRRLAGALERVHATEGAAHQAALTESLELYMMLRARLEGFTNATTRRRLQYQYPDIYNFYNIERGQPNEALQRIINRTQALEQVMTAHHDSWARVLQQQESRFTGSIRRHLDVFSPRAAESQAATAANASTGPGEVNAAASSTPPAASGGVSGVECMVRVLERAE